jgi:hypothetical protein
MTTPACGPGFACFVCRAPGPVCQGHPDCRAVKGAPCAPGCPGTPVDPNVLAVAVADTPFGPVCVTRCACCAAQGRYPRLTTYAALRLAVEHREHVAEVAR